MKLALVSFGTRGDLEPLVALAQEWRRRGREACVVGNTEVLPLAAEHGVPARDLGVSVRSLLTTQAGSRLLNAGSSAASLKILSGIIQEQLAAVGARLFDCVHDAGVIAVNERYFLLGQAAAEKLGVPIVQICFQPKGPTRAYRYPYYSAWFFRLMPPLATHRWVDRALIRRFLPVVNRLRVECAGLPPLSVAQALTHKHRTPTIQGFSRRLFPPPADWPAHLHVTGEWRLRRPAEPLARDLVTFLRSGRPNVYVGFGSMLYDPRKLEPMLTALAARLGVQLVWSLNWSGDGSVREGLVSPAVYAISGCDHDTLFPLIDVVVHHGGAGTVATAFRHGKPQLVTWFMLDQEFWAKRVADLGAGIDAGSFHRLSPRRLAASVQALSADPRYRDVAQAIASGLAAEDGAALACDCIEESIKFGDRPRFPR